MSAWGRAWVAPVAGVMAAWFIAFGDVSDSDAAKVKLDPCAAARALARSGQASEAQKAYLALFEHVPVPACARAGLLRLRRRELSTAAALVHAGYRDEAVKHIQLAREALPAMPLPIELRRFIRAQRTFDRVRALDKAGLEGAAEETLRRFIEVRPNPAGGIPADMRPYLDQEPHDPLRRFHAWVERELDSETLLWLGVALLGGALLVLEIRRIRRKRVSISIFEGTEGDNGSAVHAKSFAYELQERAQNVGVASGGRRIDLTLPPKPAEPLPTAVTDAIPQMKFVEALLGLVDRFVPTRARVVTGYLHPATAGGVGASLVLAREYGDVERQVTLRQDDFGPAHQDGAQADAGSWATLLAPATYWLLDAIGRNGSEPAFPRWKAMALFAAGASWQEQNDPDTARRLYTEALRCEPPLRDVLLNLGALEIKHGIANNDPDEVRLGISHVTQALA